MMAEVKANLSTFTKTVTNVLLLKTVVQAPEEYFLVSSALTTCLSESSNRNGLRKPYGLGRVTEKSTEKLRA